MLCSWVSGAFRSRHHGPAALLVSVVLVACGPPEGRLAAPRTATEPGRPAAGGAGESDGLTYLEQDVHVRIELDGAMRRTITRQLRFETRAAIERGGIFSVQWAPWREERPRVQAVVRLPGGGVRRLEPRTIAEEPVASNLDDKVMTDRRRLVVPLPGLVVGATVALRVVLQDRRPLVPSGAVYVAGLIPRLPIRSSRVTLDVPRALGARIESVGPGIRRKDLGVRRGRLRVQFEAGPFTEEPLWEPLLPYDRPVSPYVVVSTAPSWQAVARDYHRLVERQIQGAPGPGAPISGSRNERIEVLLARLRERVRYLSLSFGEAAIVPRSPRETLQRGFGDCKDMSALLVAWLRAAGIPAQVALLRSGFDDDTLPGHPGLDGFNHAVVHVPGDPALFIDPTARYTGALRSPLAIQGRQALVIAPATTALVRIPTSDPGENVVSELREVFLQAEGGARIVELSESRGAAEARLRAGVDRVAPTEAGATFGRYLKRLYGTEGPAQVQHPDPRDLRRPFILRLEGKGATAAQTGDDLATVRISHDLLLDTLPPYLAKPPDEGSKQATRRSDLYLAEPHRVILQYRIHPPPGYELKSAPDDGDLRLGPLRLSWKYVLDRPSGRLDARFELRTGGHRLTPAEVHETWRAVRRLRAEPWPNEVVFQHRLETLRKDGRWKEALELVRTLRRAAPGELAYVRQHVNLLLGIGYGQAARAEARRAATDRPRDGEAWFLLAQVLERNDLGIQHAEGWDRDGALAAFRRAVSLGPKNAAYRAELGRVLALDARGQFSRDPARLRAAITELQAVQKLEKGHASSFQLATLLLLSGRVQELEALVPDVEDETRRASLQVAVLALRRGVATALARARQLGEDKDAVGKRVGGAAGFLVLPGRYDLAAALMARLGEGEGLADRDFYTRFARIRPYDRPPAADTLLGAARRLVYLCGQHDLPAEKVVDAVAPPGIGGPARQVLLTLVKDLRRFLAWRLAATGTWSEQLHLDATISLLEVTASGADDLGHRVDLSVDTPGDPSPGIFFRLRLLMVKTGSGYGVLSPGENLPEAGARALAAVGRGDLVTARRWLDLALGTTVAPADPWETRPFFYLWKAATAAPADRIRLAAAALLATQKDYQPQAIPLLEAALRRPLDPATRRQVARALAGALLDQRLPARAEPLWRRLVADHPDEALPAGIHISTLQTLGRHREAERAAREHQRRRPDDLNRQVTLASVIAHLPGRLAEGVALLEKLVAGTQPPRSAYNQRAWYGLFLPTLDARAVIAAAETAVRLDQYRSYSSLDTLAVAYAEAGRLADARDAWLRQLKAAERFRPQGIDWYVYGRIAEQIGLLDIARDAYRRVTEPRDDLGLTVMDLVRRRLKGLGPAR